MLRPPAARCGKLRNLCFAGPRVGGGEPSLKHGTPGPGWAVFRPASSPTSPPPRRYVEAKPGASRMQSIPAQNFLQCALDGAKDGALRAEREVYVTAPLLLL